MINYLKSENYRLLNKKNLYITSLICFSLIAAAAFVLFYFQQADSTFPYGTSKYFYSNAISGGVMIIIIGLIFNIALTGNDTSLMKQSISFGISRNVIFWSKLILTLSYFLLFCTIAIIFMIATFFRIILFQGYDGAADLEGAEGKCQILLATGREDANH